MDQSDLITDYGIAALEHHILSPFYNPANFVCGGSTVFTLSVRASIRLSITFCFLNILNSYYWNFIKLCKHVLIYQKVQDKHFKQKSTGKGPILLELFPFVVLNGFLKGVYAYAIISYLEEPLLEFHQTLQTCSYIQDKILKQISKG